MSCSSKKGAGFNQAGVNVVKSLGRGRIVGWQQWWNWLLSRGGRIIVLMLKGSRYETRNNASVLGSCGTELLLSF